MWSHLIVAENRKTVAACRLQWKTPREEIEGYDNVEVKTALE